MNASNSKSNLWLDDQWISKLEYYVVRSNHPSMIVCFVSYVQETRVLGCSSSFLIHGNGVFSYITMDILFVVFIRVRCFFETERNCGWLQKLGKLLQPTKDRFGLAFVVVVGLCLLLGLIVFFLLGQRTPTFDRCRLLDNMIRRFRPCLVAMRRMQRGFRSQQRQVSPAKAIDGFRLNGFQFQFLQLGSQENICEWRTLLRARVSSSRSTGWDRAEPKKSRLESRSIQKFRPSFLLVRDDQWPRPFGYCNCCSCGKSWWKRRLLVVWSCLVKKVEIKIMKRRGMFPVSMDWIPFCEGGSFCYPKFEECFFFGCWQRSSTEGRVYDEERADDDK